MYINMYNLQERSIKIQEEPIDNEIVKSMKTITYYELQQSMNKFYHRKYMLKKKKWKHKFLSRPHQCKFIEQVKSTNCKWISKKYKWIANG